jgi:pimeloyl-ACP methyl ester carboxylesterase
VSEPITVDVKGHALLGDRWPGDGPIVVLLHEGVSDRRGWAEVAGRLAPAATVVTYDRRGYGETAPGAEPFSHVGDLLAVLDQISPGPAWLVGASAGGGIALDTVLTAPERVAGLVLFAPAVSGAPAPELDAGLQRLDAMMDQAMASGDLGEMNRLEIWIWLDGPTAPEGRVSGPARSLALDMNGIILRNGAPEEAGASGVMAWNRLDEVQVPVTVACGDLDVSFLISRSRQLPDRLCRGRHVELPGVAHQPYLEQPEAIAQLIAAAMAGR